MLAIPVLKRQTGRILGFVRQLVNPTWQIPGHQEAQLTDG